jgi:DNA-binding IclR family transcriptional regulator
MAGVDRLTTVEQALDMIETLDAYGTIDPTELAEELGMHKGTAYTHPRTLNERGYAVKEHGGCRLSFRFLKHGGSLTPTSVWTMFLLKSTNCSAGRQ